MSNSCITAIFYIKRVALIFFDLICLCMLPFGPRKGLLHIHSSGPNQNDAVLVEDIKINPNACCRWPNFFSCMVIICWCVDAPLKCSLLWKTRTFWSFSRSAGAEYAEKEEAWRVRTSELNLEWGEIWCNLFRILSVRYLSSHVTLVIFIHPPPPRTHTHKTLPVTHTHTHCKCYLLLISRKVDSSLLRWCTYSRIFASLHFCVNKSRLGMLMLLKEPASLSASNLRAKTEAGRTQSRSEALTKKPDSQGRGSLSQAGPKLCSSAHCTEEQIRRVDNLWIQGSPQRPRPQRRRRRGQTRSCTWAFTFSARDRAVLFTTLPMDPFSWTDSLLIYFLFHSGFFFFTDPRRRKKQINVALKANQDVNDLFFGSFTNTH